MRLEPSSAKAAAGVAFALQLQVGSLLGPIRGPVRKGDGVMSEDVAGVCHWVFQGPLFGGDVKWSVKGCMDRCLNEMIIIRLLGLHV